ncbi:MAG: hypothetical protein KKA90_00630 [Nanoarchaeota archaeon]|nr:hypothetical protein [Nanoarchaeota archaeon]
MAYTLMLPSLRSGSGHSLKDSLLSVLATRWPLTARQLYYEVKRAGAAGTYQGVYKALKELVSEGVVEKEERTYRLSPRWVVELARFLKQTGREAGNAALPSYFDFQQNGNAQSFTFQTLEAHEQYRKRLQREFFADQQKRFPYFGQSTHMRSPLVFTERALGILRLVKETGTYCYIAIQGDTPIDRWCAASYHNKYITVKTGVPLADGDDIMVLDDIVVQSFFDQRISKVIDAFYQQRQDIVTINVPTLYNTVYRKQAEHHLVVQKNPLLAATLRNRILSYFRV